MNVMPSLPADGKSVMRSRRNRPALVILVVAFLAIVLFVIWSLWAELDQISRARGQVIPSGRVQVIQSSDGGVISRIAVNEGDHVTRGQLLMTLDSVKVESAVEETRARVAALKGTMTRIEAELFHKPLTFPADVRAYPDIVRNQTSLYQQRVQALDAQLKTLGEMRTLARQELDMNLPLVKSGDVSQSEVLRMQRNVADVEGQIIGARNKYLEQLQAEYTKTQQDLTGAEQELTQRREVLSATNLVSPVNGIVKNIRLTTVGGVLGAGDEAMQIVPTGDDLIVEAKVAPSDIAFIRTGQTASVKFDAYDSSIYGTSEGTVTFVSPDTMAERGSDGAENVFYRVHLTVDTSTMRPHHPGEKIEIQPGMTVVAEIKTGENTLFRYLTKPILKTTSESFGER
ncbi:HlyD family type I secretion periplasmic adaptor subunit [Hephaestia sp. GCM10023244]|uniref:HlyD family type I secretion periplasmic adaptor subunit n=1 Tax=unclassified Hephaestia TaxID=2631281 RepID=UPI00207721C2|nr:HlyD family type I secretion periplasmic adaptor subunit [Hephaestia sp. MAHUQ-44]MCM8732011.1 HlyD family type I secretion periplasmic adaptor subunit [Hephaestia sp. MAHUQ-44]